ncbi:MAG: aminotransferase class IV [Isosphaeraceae bacterium]
MAALACLNGEIMPPESARVPIWDRGFLFGDSIYEVYRLYGGRPWLEGAHTARLERSLREVEIHGVDLDQLRDRVGRTIDASGIREGTVYIQITRGSAPRLHAYPNPPVPPTELIVVRPYDDVPAAKMREAGVKVISLPDRRWGRCDIKSTNLLANVMANEAAHRGGGFEAILIDDRGLVTEATHSSLLWARGGVLAGTPEGPEILPGTTRGLVLRLAGALGIPFEAGRVTLEDLKASDEAILVGTTIEVLPVVRVDDDAIGDGRPGPIARHLQAAYREELSSWLSP